MRCQRCPFEGESYYIGPLGCQCPECLGWLEPNRIHWLYVAGVALLMLAGAPVAILLSACSAPFEAQSAETPCQPLALAGIHKHCPKPAPAVPDDYHNRSRWRRGSPASVVTGAHDGGAGGEPSMFRRERGRKPELVPQRLAGLELRCLLGLTGRARRVV